MSARSHAEGFYSRYAARRLVGPPPHKRDAFVDFVLDAIKREGIDVVLPIGQDSNAALSRARTDVLEHSAIAVADWSSMQVASSKRRTIECARVLGVPVPQTFESPAEVDRFPIVAKKIMGSGEVRYVNSVDEIPGGEQWLLQEYIPGEGRGFFALLDHGEEKAVSCIGVCASIQ